jgi:Polyketide cyclase / dehydrase and lipid transport
MDLTADLVAPCRPDELFVWVADLRTYPRWLGLVERVEREDSDVDAWIVDIGARIGPFARSKRLRMVEADRVEATRVVFERRELDGRDHGEWRMSAELEPDGDATRLTMRLHYGGRLWGPVLEPVLADEVDRSRRRLVDLVEGSTAP